MTASPEDRASWLPTAQWLMYFLAAGSLVAGLIVADQLISVVIPRCSLTGCAGWHPYRDAGLAVGASGVIQALVFSIVGRLCGELSRARVALAEGELDRLLIKDLLAANARRDARDV